MKYYVVYKDGNLTNKISFYKYESLDLFKEEFPELMPICLLDGYPDNIIISPKHKEF